MKKCTRCRFLKDESEYYQRKDGRLHTWCKTCFASYKKQKHTAEQPRKYLPSLGELIDRLSIVQLKEVFITEHKSAYAQEIADIVHDIQQIIDQNKLILTAENIRDIVIVSEYNHHIWQNESKARRGEEGSDLRLTHGLNSIRNQGKNRIQEAIGGRRDYKLDNVEAYKQWVPSGYDSEKMEEVQKRSGAVCPVQKNSRTGKNDVQKAPR